MQQLANKGVKFTNAYAQSMCTSSRVSLMTGMAVARHKVTSYIEIEKDSPTDASYDGIKWPNWNYNGMALSNEYKNTVVATPFPELLRQSGNYTAIVGKGHFAPFGISASNPKNIGFIDAVARISWERISFFW